MKPLHLRIDVCTFRGLRDGVPAILDLLQRTGIRATFFVAFGPDTSGRALPRLLSPPFLRAMLRRRAASCYGLATAFYGTLLPAPLIGAGLPDIVRRIRDEGHEVGAHGWDHRAWQDRLPRYAPERLREEFARMVESYRAELGRLPASFAAPAWTVTAGLLEAEEANGLRYASDARGGSPFLPVFEGQNFDVPQLPVSLPTLDELLTAMDRSRAVEEVLAQARSQPDYACFTAHAEIEGWIYRGEFETILRRIERPVEPLGEALLDVERLDDLPLREIRMAAIPGRAYAVCRVVEG